MPKEEGLWDEWVKQSLRLQIATALPAIYSGKYVEKLPGSIQRMINNLPR